MTMIYWMGSESQQHLELSKACKARCKQYGKHDCPRPDHFCDECKYDQMLSMQVSKDTFERAVANGEIDPVDWTV